MAPTEFLLSIMQPDGPAPEADVLGPIMAEVAALGDDLRASGAWVFSGGLTPPEDARVARVAPSGVVVTDGPYTEAKEHLGGFWVIRAEDLDSAMGWATRAARATTLPIEVRELDYASGT
jgi:hypothetical protein